MNSIQKIPYFPRQFVYFEKQSNDRLCGVHCLNSLVQAPLFDPISLSVIANNLDELEKNLYEEDINSIYNIKNENVDDDGNYNVQVLTEALQLQGTEIVPVKQHECETLLNESMDSLEGFIFNSSTHWFAIRKIFNIWFNLNSTNSGPGPQIISDFYLSAFIKGTEELGYTNFLVKSLPDLPELDSGSYKNLQNYQRLVTIEEIVNYKPKKHNIRDNDPRALEKLIEFSKEEYFLNNDYAFNYNDSYNYAIEDFQIKNYEKNFNEQEEELNVAMEVSVNEYVEELEKSLPQEPSEGSEHIKIEFKIFQNNAHQNYQRKFNFSDKIGDLKNYVRTKLKSYGKIRLSGAFRNKNYLNDDQTLKEAGMQNSETLVANIVD